MEEILHRLSISSSTCPRTPSLTLSGNAAFWAFGQMTEILHRLILLAPNVKQGVREHIRLANKLEP